MRKLILIAHTSLDGFVASPSGELDGFDAGAENLEFVCRLTKQADAALFGRVSYQLLHRYWPAAKDNPAATWGEVAYSHWYNKAQKIVISKTLDATSLDNTTVISENIPNAVLKIKHQPGKDILLFGSPTVAQLLMQHHLIDSYWIFVNPVIFGNGIPLFAGTGAGLKLELAATQSFPNGEMALYYTMKSAATPHVVRVDTALPYLV